VNITARVAQKLYMILIKFIFGFKIRAHKHLVVLHQGEIEKETEKILKRETETRGICR
jgi:hypothetical protein